MIRKPAHKDVLHPPGQCEMKNDFDRYTYIHKPKTLGDVIDSVKKHEELLMNEKKKLTFDEWFSKRYSDLPSISVFNKRIREAWYAGQENK